MSLGQSRAHIKCKGGICSQGSCSIRDQNADVEVICAAVGTEAKSVDEITCKNKEKIV